MENYLAVKNEEEKEKLAVFHNPLRTLSAHRKVRDFLPQACWAQLTCCAF